MYLFTGVDTSFVIGINLHRGDPTVSDGIFSHAPNWKEWMAEAKVSEKAYGDVEVIFAARNGTLKSGYICGYGWGFAEAATVCRQLGYETGLPTYRGVFSGWMRKPSKYEFFILSWQNGFSTFVHQRAPGNVRTEVQWS